MTEQIGRHLIIDGIYNKETHDAVHKDRTALAQYLEDVTKITGMTLVFPPIAMSFPFAGETNKLIQRFGVVKDVSSPYLEEKLNNESLTFYIGTDPTADSLHLGH